MKHSVVRFICAALWLTACSGDGDDGADPALTREQLLNPESCKDCHPKHYREWSGSMHAYAIQDPVFQAMNRRGQEETNGELGEFCVNCHAPMAVREDAFENGDFADLEQVPEPLRGVTCYFCHNVEKVGKDHFNNSLVLANDTTMRGSIRDPLQPGAHKAAFSPFYDRDDAKSSQMCGSCHDIVTPMGVHLERTYEEYLSSFFVSGPGQDSCAGCHMTGVTGVAADYKGVATRQVHEHVFAGVDVPLDDFPYREAATAAVADCMLPSSSIQFFDVQPDSIIPGEFSISVSLETSAGHNQPSGASQDRRMWLEVTAFDADGEAFFKSGHIADDELEETSEDDPAHDPYLWQFRERMLDADGNEVHMFWEAASTTSLGTEPLPVGRESLVPGSHSLTRGYSLGAVPARIEFRVRIRPVGLDALDNLIESGHLAAEVRDAMPTFTVFSGEAVWNANEDGKGMRFVTTRTTEFDCHKHECLFDPTADGC